MNIIKNINDWKIGKKLFVGYGFLIIVIALLTIFNSIVILKINSTYVNLQKGTVEINQHAMKMGMDFSAAWQNLTMAPYLAYENMADEYKASIENFNNSISMVAEEGESIKQIILNDNDINDEKIDYLNEILQMITVDFVSLKDTMETQIKESSLYGDDLLEVIRTSVTTANTKAATIHSGIDYIIEDTDLIAKEIQAKTSNDVYDFVFSLCIYEGIFIVIAIIYSCLISRSIKNPIVKLSNASAKIAKGKLNTPIRLDSKDELGALSNAFGNVVEIFSKLGDDINYLHSKLLEGDLSIAIDERNYKGDYKKIASSVNNTIEYVKESTFSAIQCAEDYANGNFETVINRYPGEQAALNETFDLLQNNLRSIIDDLNHLTQSVIEGNLDAKIDCDNYNGDWKEISEGMNSLLEAVKIPIVEVCSVLEHVAEGKFSTSIQGNYNGQFEQMKTAVNTTIKNSEIYVNDISDILIKMSNQDLDIEINRDYGGDFSRIKSALLQIIDTFNRIIAEFKQSAEQVAEGSKQISDSSMILSEGATEQACALEETAATTEMITKQTSVNAENAEEVRSLALEAQKQGVSSKADMDELLIFMSDISEASMDIHQIINVIDDIAFQINLLSLNAAVEAARAGTHGKGFAVVAEEVRNLADRSKKAASETSKLINKTVGMVEDGSKIANDTSASINEMVNRTSEIAKLIDDISISTKEQDASIQQINQAINQISEVTQSNTATAEENSSMSQELTSQSEMLRNVLIDFKHKAL